MTQSMSDKASEMAESLRNKMSDTFAPLKDPKVSELFTSCYGPAENDFENENSYKPNSMDAFAEMDQKVRKVVKKTLRRNFKCNGEDDAETVLTEAFKDDNGSSYYDDYTTSSKTVGLNTVDDRNNVLGQNKNATNSEVPAYKQSFKDKYVEMKARQQFGSNPANSTPSPNRKPELAIDALEAAKQYEAAKIEKQRRAEYSRKLAEKRFGSMQADAPMDPRSPRASPMVPRTPIDP